MRPPFQTSIDRSGLKAGRWTLAGALMIGLHVSGGAAGYIYWGTPPTELILPSSSVIAFELAPIPVAPPPPPPQVFEMPEIEPVVEPPPPITELDLIPPAPPEVKVAVAVPEKPKPVKKMKKKKEQIKKKVEKKPEQPPQPKLFKTASDTPSTTRVESPPQPVVAAAPIAAGPTPAEEARVAQAKIMWEQAFRKHIKRYQKYPKSAKRKHQEGSPTVEFVFDREGNVLEARISRSSGFEALDEEAINSFQRASPLPPMPPEVVGETLRYRVSIGFSLN